MARRQQVNLRIICMNPIRQCRDADEIRLGLQNKKGQLQSGHEKSADQVVFDFSLNVSRHDDGTPNLTGPFAHGTRQKRFVYLTYQILEGDGWSISRRIKAPLHMITWDQVQTALAADCVLQARVSGLRTGTVPLLDGGWLTTE